MLDQLEHKQKKIAKVEKRGKRKKGKSKKREKERQKERQSGTSLADMMNDEEDKIVVPVAVPTENIEKQTIML